MYPVSTPVRVALRPQAAEMQPGSWVPGPTESGNSPPGLLPRHVLGGDAGFPGHLLMERDRPAVLLENLSRQCGQGPCLRIREGRRE